MKDQAKNLMIGIFVVSAISIIVFMILFLHPYVGDEGQIVRVRFTDIEKVNVGTRVTFAGKPIGEVVEITELEDVRRTRKEEKGDIYVYELKLAIDSGVNIYNTDSIQLRTAGLLGERSIAIDPKPLKPGQELRLVNDQILFAEQVGTVEETFKEFKEVADRFDTVLDMMSDALNELKERKMWENVSNVAENLSEMSDKFADSWPTIDESLTNVSAITSDLSKVSDNILKGEGTVGRLVSTDDLYLRTTSLFSKGETTLDDINHYGLLFHLDKGWQRMRARRLNLLQKLSSPQEFRNFFNDELNQISTSLARVGMIMEGTECDPCYPCLIEDREFSKVFAELLRRVEDLEEKLKMYNNQLMQCEVDKTELASERIY